MLKHIRIAIFLLVFISMKTFAQSPVSTKGYEIALNTLQNQHPWLLQEGNQSLCEYTRVSEIGEHFQFVQLFNGIPVYGATAKVNLAKNQQVLSVFSDFVPVLHAPNQLHSNQSTTYQKVWQAVAGQLYPAYVSIVKNAKGEYIEQLLSDQLQLVQTRKLSLNARKDTLVQAMVFNPDPLTSAQKAYGEGGQYKNYGGADSPELNAQRFSKGLTLRFENDTFFAENKYAIMLDLETPSQIPFASKVANFNFTRSQSQFREFNCLYHIEAYREYLKSIGLPFNSMFQVEVDPTAYQGFDQSRFDYSGEKPGLFFGTGGVPDAEDADVIVHEYTHAINYFIAPNTTNGNQRLAVEEANCDVMSCFYSKNISTYQWRDIFSWDGHNEFWDGRDGSTDYKYPDDLSSDFYESSLIWSSMLNDIGEDIGRDALTRILFNSVYSYANNINMQQAANLFLQSDSLLNGRKHYGAIKNRMRERGFDVSIGVRELTGDLGYFKMLNSYGFVLGNGSLEVLSKSKDLLTVQFYSLDGKLMLSKQSADQRVLVAPWELPAGAYLVDISTEDAKSIGKVIKY